MRSGTSGRDRSKQGRGRPGIMEPYHNSTQGSEQISPVANLKLRIIVLIEIYKYEVQVKSVHTINKPGRGQKIVRMGASLLVVEPCGPGLTPWVMGTKSIGAAKPYATATAYACLTRYQVALVAANWGLQTVGSPRRVTQRQTRHPGLDAAASSESAQAVSFPSGHRCVLCPGWTNGSYDVRCTRPPVPKD
jgi:hypothetical protein